MVLRRIRYVITEESGRYVLSSLYADGRKVPITHYPNFEAAEADRLLLIQEGK